MAEILHGRYNPRTGRRYVSVIETRRKPRKERLHGGASIVHQLQPNDWVHLGLPQRMRVIAGDAVLPPTHAEQAITLQPGRPVTLKHVGKDRVQHTFLLLGEQPNMRTDLAAIYQVATAFIAVPF